MQMKGIVAYTILSVFCFQFAFSQSNPKSDDDKDIDRLVKSYMKDGKIPGLSLVIIKDGKQTIRSYGYSNVEEKKPVTAGTLFQIGSCSKAFTGLAALQLEQENRLNLDSYVSDYLPWFTAYYKHKEVKITVRQLLHHTSGISWKTIAAIPQNNSADALEQTIRNITGINLHQLPGKQYEYATINYDIIALIIQRVTGQPFEKYMEDSLITKLHLPHTTIGVAADNASMAVGYKISFLQPRPYVSPIFKGNNAAGYIISNATDIATWLNMQMGLTNTELSLVIKKSHQRDETVPPAGLYSYAVGWQVSLSGNGEIVHTGENPNYTSYIAFRPEKKIAVAILANANSSYTPFLGDRIIKTLSGDEIKEDANPDNGSDKIFTCIAMVLGCYIIIVLAFLGYTIFEIITRRRKRAALSLKKGKKIASATVFLTIIIYAVYLLPLAIGFNWKAVQVWAPDSFTVMAMLLVTALGLSYLMFLLSTLFPGKKQLGKEVARVVQMSVIAGLSNMTLILLITSSLKETIIPLKFLAGYYLVLLAIYISSRKYVQAKLIRISRELMYETRVKLIDKIFTASYEQFEKIDRGKFYSTLNNDILIIGESANMGVMLITSLITATGIFIYLATLQLWATLLTIGLIVFLSVLYTIISKKATVYFGAARDTQDVFMRLINGMIDGFKEISMHRRKKTEYKNDITPAVKEYKEKTITAELKLLRASLIGESSFIILLGIVAFGIPKFFPNIPSYSVMNFVVLLLYLNGALHTILNAVPSIMQLKISWGRIQQFIREIPATQDMRIAPPASNRKIIESIKAERLSFKYLDNDGSELFSMGPVDLELKRGQILFIIGGNGSGKTTLIKLITGLYKPNKGRVLINDEEVRGAELGEHISAVFNPNYLFDKLYAVDVEDKWPYINEYLKMLGLDQKVSIHNNKYSTINLSTGQRKRLALLQCYLEDYPICLFDEWAADQDPEYRHFFYRVLLPRMRASGKIVIAVTHDEHYFDVADKILKMDRQGVHFLDSIHYISKTKSYA
jgi:cyclic peptide transporter